MIHRRGYIPEFDGLRGVAILLVMAFHIWRYTGDAVAGRAVSLVAGMGWAGVDVFFVLSGFLITGILLDTKGRPRYWRNFFIRRSLRIFPLYYAVMTALVAGAVVIDRLDLAIDDPALATIDKAWINYLYLTNFVKAFWGANVVPLDIAWSLAVEEQFYIFFPFVVRWA
ncbi:MAG: acyltransferase, partial [Planctomycetota bacterium]